MRTTGDVDARGLYTCVDGQCRVKPAYRTLVRALRARGGDEARLGVGEGMLVRVVRGGEKGAGTDGGWPRRFIYHWEGMVTSGRNSRRRMAGRQ